jgi:ABC-type Fe3+-siderophore transport system permease subunit
LLLSGVLLGVYLNVFILSPSIGILNYAIEILIFGVFTFCFVLVSWNGEKKLGKNRKSRLLFFGISFVSFFVAMSELFQFLLAPHGLEQALFAYSDSYPYFWIGSIPLISFLGSAVSGGFFGLLERLLELLEKKDL